MMWRKVLEDGTVVVTTTVEGPGFYLGPDDTVGVEGWEPVPDDYVESPEELAAKVAELQARLDSWLIEMAGG